MHKCKSAITVNVWVNESLICLLNFLLHIYNVFSFILSFGWFTNVLAIVLYKPHLSCSFNCAMFYYLFKKLFLNNWFRGWKLIWRLSIANSTATIIMYKHAGISIIRTSHIFHSEHVLAAYWFDFEFSVCFSFAVYQNSYGEVISGGWGGCWFKG